MRRKEQKMKTRILIIPLVLICLILPMATYLNAAEDLSDGWQPLYDPGPVSFSAVGETLSVTAGVVGAEVWAKWHKEFDDTIGALATINISSIVSANDSASYIGLRKYIGQLPSGNYIVAGINVQSYNSDKRIFYRIRERDQNHQHIRVIALGFLGETSGSWNTGEDIDVGLAYINGNIVFYTSKNNAYSIVRLQEPITYPSERSQFIEIQTYASSGYSPVIVGTVGNVAVLYIEDLKVFRELAISNCDTNNDGRAGIEELIYILQTMTSLR